MFFPKSPKTQSSTTYRTNEHKDTLKKLEEYGYVYMMNGKQSIGILLTISTFKKLHAYAQDKIMDKLRSYEGY